MFKHIIREREQQGVDFWWLDWQQNLTSNFTEGLSETFWCNHVFFHDMEQNRKDRRPMIFHRWGGLGSHRYPIGFSGDTHASFGSLAFQPYFTATASNVCFGYWGHDLGGHLQIAPTNPELMLRWLQFGVFSPIFRTHGANQDGNERRIWKYSNFNLLLACVNLRYELMPYIYTAARQAYDTGVSICRPLYYDWPEDNEAYRQEGEYMFGDDILVSPVVTASENGSQTFHKTWLPEGAWYDVCRNRMLNGSQTISDNYALEEIPYFIKEGTILVCNQKMMNLKTAPTKLMLKVVPGNGETTLYEDEGDTQNYKEGHYTTTLITQTSTSGMQTITIHPRQGSYEGMPTARGYDLRLYLNDKPAKLLVEGASQSAWSYDAKNRIVRVNIASTDCSGQLKVILDNTTNGIGHTQAPVLIEERCYDLNGRQVVTAPQGPYVVKRLWNDGSVTTQKVM